MRISLLELSQELGHEMRWLYKAAKRGFIGVSGYVIRLETVRDHRGRLAVTRELWDQFREKLDDPMYTGPEEDVRTRRGKFQQLGGIGEILHQRSDRK